MKDLPRFLLDSANSGVYAAPAGVQALKPGAVACGLAWFELDLTGVIDKATFLSRCQTVFSLPATFGHNWDALADYLEDLSWQRARGYIVFGSHGSEFARGAPHDCVTALEILSAAATYWLAQNKTFIALLDADTRGSRKVKLFPA